MVTNNLNHQTVYYHENKLFLAYIENFRIKPKARTRTHQTNKGKKCAFTPTSKNQQQFNFRLKEETEKNYPKFKTFVNDVGLMVSIRARGTLRGDTDNYLKQIKDALQYEKYPIVCDDRIIKCDYVEKLEKCDEDSVVILLKRIVEDDYNHGLMFALVNHLVEGLQ